MPWNVSSVVEKRLRFVEEWAEGRKSRSALCEEYGISRKTGYAMWERFRREGEAALEEVSRRPHSCPHQTPTDVERRVLELRGSHPLWGPKKLAALMEREGIEPPACSTIAAILKRHGLSHPQRRRRHEAPSSPPLVEAGAPNEVWSTDFKGHFYVGTGERCDPLTVMDLSSRYLLVCHGYFTEPGKIRQEEVIDVYRSLFSLHGIPRFIVSDNGGPFASSGPGGLTKLSAFWIRLGITPLRIDSGKPQQNGRLERLHRTLKSEVARPARRTVAEQKKSLCEFQEEYNKVRPHEALAMATPASCHRAAPPWDGIVPAPLFPEEATVRHVTRVGGLKWHGRMHQMPMALADQDVGLVPVENGQEHMLVYLCHYCIGVLDLHHSRILSAPRPAQLLRFHTPGQEPEPPLVVNAVTL